MPRTAAPLPDLPETFWAWLAGYVEADGNIGIYNVHDRRTGYTYPTPRITIAQKDPEALQVIKACLGTGSLGRRGHTYTGSIMYALVFGSGASRLLCSKMLPYLVAAEKRARCQRVLDYRRHKWGELHMKEAS